MRALASLLLPFGIGLLAWSAAAEEEKPAVVENGRKVSIEYTLRLEDGSVADSNVGQEPLVYQQGADQILPGLEQALSGMKTGDSRTVELTAQEGYGEVDPRLFLEVEADMVPEGARTAGTELLTEDPDGNRRVVRVHEVREGKIVIDHNHPLAGQALYFDVRIVGLD